MEQRKKFLGHARTPKISLRNNLLSVLPLLLFTITSQAATLRIQSSLDSPDVRLSDLFDDAGPQATRVLGSAPPPGDQLIIEAPQLAAIARQFGVAWRPSSGTDHVVLDREGHPLPLDELVAILQTALQRSGAAADCDISLDGFVAPMVPTDSTLRIAAERVEFDPVSSRFSALLVINGERTSTIHSRVTGRAEAMVALPVPVRRIPAGTLVTAADLRPGRVRSTLVHDEPTRSIADALGLQARRSLMPGLPISLADLQPAALVRKNTSVGIILSSPGMSVSAVGIAMESAPLGGHVRILNPVSHAVIEADVTGPDEVTVTIAPRGPGQLAAR